MDPVVLLTVIAKYGVPFVAGLVEKARKKQLVTFEEWDALVLKIETPGDALVPKRPGA